ncbi:MAG: DUF3592 domain-containing protein [Candidatus Angelobacter sp.]
MLKGQEYRGNQQPISELGNVFAAGFDGLFFLRVCTIVAGGSMVEWTWVRAEGLRKDHKVPEVCYSYSVNGESYSGTYGTREATFDLFPKGSRILVHYSPAKPSISFLDREELRMRQTSHR